MDGPLILYLHGFRSSPASWKAQRMAEEMARRGLAERFVCPALSPVPQEAVAAAEAVILGAGGPVTLIGSSLGGHYAAFLAEKHDLRAALINPAVIHPGEEDRFLGRHETLYTGETFHFTPRHAAQLACQHVPRPTPERYWLLVEEGDEVLDHRLALAHYAGCRQTVLPGGDHSFTRFPEFIGQLIEFASTSCQSCAIPRMIDNRP